MPVPKHRTSASKKNMRRSHHALSRPSASVCPNCQEVKQPHIACRACGHYSGRQVMASSKTESTWDGNGSDFNSES